MRDGPALPRVFLTSRQGRRYVVCLFAPDGLQCFCEAGKVVGSPEKEARQGPCENSIGESDQKRVFVKSVERPAESCLMMGLWMLGPRASVCCPSGTVCRSLPNDTVRKHQLASRTVIRRIKARVRAERPSRDFLHPRLVPSVYLRLLDLASTCR